MAIKKYTEADIEKLISLRDKKLESINDTLAHAEQRCAAIKASAKNKTKTQRDAVNNLNYEIEVAQLYIDAQKWRNQNFQPTEEDELYTEGV